jgi:hypothetical protein
MHLWIVWYQTVAALRPACARTRTFLWLVVVLAAMTVRTDLAGVTSLVRSHWLQPRSFTRPPWTCANSSAPGPPWSPASSPDAWSASASAWSC